MATKKSSSSLAALTSQIASLQAQADAIREKEVADVIAKAKDAIAHYGLTASDLGFASTPRGRKALGASPGSTGTSARGPASTRKKGKDKSAKFRDEHGNSWGGIGKRPNWFKDALAAGKTPADLMVKP